MNTSALQESVFLQALGWAIANSVWQAAALWIFYKILIASYENAAAKLKNNLSTALLFGSFGWFIITFLRKIFYPGEYLPGAGASESFLGSHRATIPDTITFGKYISTWLNALPYLSLAYLLLLIVFAIKLINSYRNTSFIKNNGLSRPAAEWRLFVQKVANHINISKEIKLWFSMYIDVPATIGFFKPVILIPLASLNQLTPHQLEAIILHEIFHIRRNDYLVNLLITLIETILFFNPFVVLLTRTIKKERENCCDDFVLQYQYDRHSYASALLVLEQSRDQQLQFALTATSGKRQLLHRVKRIMEVKNSNTGLNYGQKLLALVLCTGIIGSIAWLTPNKGTHQQTIKDVKSKVIVTYPFSEGLSLNNVAQKRYKKPLAPSVRLQTKDNFLKVGDKTGVPQVAITPGISTFGVDNPEKSGQKNMELKKIQNTIGALFPNLANQVSVATENLASFPDFLLEKSKFFENDHLNFDLNQLKSDILRESQQSFAFDWPVMEQEINENSDEVALKDLNNRIKSENFNSVKEEGHAKNRKEDPRRSLFRRLSDDIQSQQVRLLKSRDSLIIYSSNGKAELLARYNSGYAPAVLVQLNKDRLGETYRPAPLRSLNGKKPAGKQEMKSDNYTYQYYTLPKVKSHNNTSININREGIVLNGQKINLTGLEHYDVEKKANKIIIKDSTHIIEIELNE